MKKNTIIEIISALFILLFLYTALSKFLSFNTFNSMLRKSPLIGDRFAPFVLWAIPIGEIGISLLLFFPKTRQTGLWLSLCAMIMFTAYIGYLAYFAPDHPCSCGGVIKQMNWNQHFIFNIFFTLLGVIALWLYRKQRLKNDKNELPNNIVFT